MIPHRWEIESLLGPRYQMLQMRFDSLHMLEFNERTVLDAIERELPPDSVASARIDGMPHHQVAMVSDPTLRIVMARERILAVALAPVRMDPDRRDFLEFTFHALLLATDIWRSLQRWERTLLDAWYWERRTKEGIADLFRTDAQWSGHRVPTSTTLVKEAHHDILARIDTGYREQWGWIGGGMIRFGEELALAVDE